MTTRLEQNQLEHVSVRIPTYRRAQYFQTPAVNVNWERWILARQWILSINFSR